MEDRTEWIVSRSLHDEDTGAEVVVGVGRPRPDDRGDWACAFTTDKASPECTRQAYGVDEFQALLLAIEGLHMALSRDHRRLTWLGEPGDTGVPRLSPLMFGLAFRQRIEQLIDHELEQHAEAGRERYERRRGGR